MPFVSSLDLTSFNLPIQYQIPKTDFQDQNLREFKKKDLATELVIAKLVKILTIKEFITKLVIIQLFMNFLISIKSYVIQLHFQLLTLLDFRNPT